MFVLFEILKINELVSQKEKLNIACLGEAPGAFIQSIKIFRDHFHQQSGDVFHAISKNKFDLQILNGKNTKIHDSNGEDAIQKFSKTLANSVDFVTANGEENQWNDINN